ncbi:MAG: methyltransferase domain-containing protein [Thermoleophilia bacterium]|nr:methyltransferase domain-containing protein [Thermoleophilia bacterium]
MRLPDGFDVVTEHVTVAGLTVEVRRPRSAEDLIDEDEYARDERLPYWADLWPSGQVLAEWVATQPLRGLRVIELGAGLALPSLMALRQGARALATDWYPEALEFARANADRAGVGRLATMVVDWGAPSDEAFADAPYDLVLGADILYENRHPAQLAPLIARLSGPRTRVVIADPRRPAAGGLIAEMRETDWRHERIEVRFPGRPDEQGSVIHRHEFTRRVPRT